MQTTPDRGEKTRPELEAIRDDMQTIADEIRLQIHLAGMDAKDAWGQLDPELLAFERRFERASDLVLHELHDVAGDLRARLRKLRAQL